MNETVRSWILLATSVKLQARLQLHSDQPKTCIILCKRQYNETIQKRRTLQSKSFLALSNLYLEIKTYNTNAMLISCDRKFQPGNNMLHVFFPWGSFPARISIIHYEKLLPLYFCPPLFFVKRATLSCLCCSRHWDHLQCGCRLMETNWPQLNPSPSPPFAVYSMPN